MFATATAISRLDALIAGAKAVMAVTPQMDVPEVKSSDISKGSPATLLAMGMYNMPAPTADITTGNEEAPAFTNSKNDNRAATATIPV